MMTHLASEANYQRIPLNIFIVDYYESFGANIIPYSNYAVFLALLLKKGLKVLLKLLAFLLGKKKDVIFDLLQFYQSSVMKFKELSRQLPWELFMEDLKTMK